MADLLFDSKMTLEDYSAAPDCPKKGSSFFSDGVELCDAQLAKTGVVYVDGIRMTHRVKLSHLPKIQFLGHLRRLDAKKSKIENRVLISSVSSTSTEILFNVPTAADKFALEIF